MQPILEVCACSVQSVLNAERAGASRVELCENLFIGGTTPSYGCLKVAREQSTIPIYVLIRPRAGDFCYSRLELEQIKNDIIIAKSLKADGIVCGVLHGNGKVNEQQTRELVELSYPLPFTFHRAFDFTPDPYEALEAIIRCRAGRILTSGQQNKAFNAIDLLTNLVERAANRIVIMPGSGVNSDTVPELVKTGAVEFHASGVTTVESSMTYRKKSLSLNGSMLPDYANQETNEANIRNIIAILQKTNNETPPTNL